MTKPKRVNPLKDNQEKRVPLTTKKVIIEEVCMMQTSSNGTPKYAAIGKLFNISRQAVSKIYNNRDKILQHLKESPNSRATVLSLVCI
jgi:hypothetical protein